MRVLVAGATSVPGLPLLRESGRAAMRWWD